MNLYQVNNDLTYPAVTRIRSNVFLNMPAEEEDPPQYEAVRHLLPKPLWEGHKDVIACYDFAWKTAFGNLRKADASNRFVSNYIDTAFNGFLFMWDSAFNVMFGKYGAKAFDFQKTLNNFYSHQHKDGFICREICETAPGEHYARHDPSSTGPNVLGWAEWEYYCQTGDKERLFQIFEPLLSYHLWLKRYRTWRNGTYWTTGWGCGMDNQPRLEEGYSNALDHGHMVWVDACIQQVLSAKVLVAISKIIEKETDERIELLKKEIDFLTKFINEELWCEGDAFYYDLYRDGRLNYVKSVGAYWALLADLIPKERLEPFVAHLQNEAEFQRPFCIPSLSADHPAYHAQTGEYWRGGVWAPTNYMVLKGLEKNGYHALAHQIAQNCLANVVTVFNRTGTLYENYAPEEAKEGVPAKKDFVGWSGLFPINILFEYVFGLRPMAREKKIVWDVNLLERHGVRNYPLGACSLDLICSERKSHQEEPVITAICEETVEIEIHYGDQTKTVFSKRQ